jgi:hypothetical protein
MGNSSGQHTYTIDETPEPAQEKNGYYWWKKPDNDRWEPAALVNGRVSFIGQTATRARADVAGDFVLMHEPVESD